MFCTALGVKTHYQRIGNGPKLVMLHGWGCTWEIWSPVIAQLSEKYQLILPDLPGFGSSSHSEEVWDSALYAQWLEAFLKETVGRESYTLLGHSFGGKIACLFASTHPKRLQQLFVVDASGLPDPLSSKKRIQQQLIGAIPQFIKEAIPFGLKKMIFIKIQASDDYLVANPYLKKVLKRIFPEYIAKELQQIQTPTTVLWGQHDIVTPIHQGEKFAALIPNATLVPFSQSGHYPFIDETMQFIKQIV